MADAAESLSHSAFLALEALIVTLKLAPGSLVTEKQLIDLTGHGRTPVREAIQKLAWQGLIEVRPRVGLQISAINPLDYAEIMQTRCQLEPLAARLVARVATDAQRGELIGCAQAMTACSITGDIAGFLDADQQFDAIIEAACPNRFLTAALAPLKAHARRMWFSHASAGQMDRSINLHVKVIRAIHAGDEDAAERGMLALLDDLTAP